MSNLKRLKLSSPRNPRGSIPSHETVEIPRKKNSLRLKTEVDWNEDLRPTDDEHQPQSKSEIESPSIPSQELSRESETKKTHDLRKSGPTPLAGSTKRKTAKKREKMERDRPKIGTLPLTALTAASKTKSRAKIIGSDRKLTPMLPCAQGIIEISSVSSASSSSASSSDDLNAPTVHLKRSLSTTNDGRGKAVGQKLAHALREADLPSKARDLPGLMALDQPVATEHGQEETKSPPSRMSSIDSSAHAYIDQVQMLLHGQNRTASATGNKQSPGLSPFRFAALTTLSPIGLPDDSLSNEQQQQKRADGIERHLLPQNCSTDTTEQGPIIAHEHHSGATQTPESQKPLLIQQTPLPESPRTGLTSAGLKSSIVDQNGSPRLKDSTVANPSSRMLSHDQLTEMDIDGNPTTANFYYLSECSDSDCSDCSDCSSDDGPILRSKLPCSKFMRTMLLEYGLDPLKAREQRDCELLAGKHDAPADSDPMGPFETFFYPCPEDDSAVPTQDSHATNPFNITNRPKERAETTGRNSIKYPSVERPRSAINPSNKIIPPLPAACQPAGLDSTDWITDLQTAQSYAHSLLNKTNQSLSSQLATEHEAVRHILALYQTGCHRILDSIARAQAIRMQEVSTMKNRIYQDISSGLQELTCRVQEMQQE
ncbi:hypothetical protein N7468_004001 [Penicillium chermesinum]|uniref:Uncharacterized protein n=1 Tax=Penicillium chermesinum TaxID=63820 RepID=A0A9W9PAE4_9EURO|nr:uncharacterized protein N7468_004001 [Penicillium chermesinum]KAJ5239382.1 hypothetical protein N7468_004001 [Penicillium chermesinum]